MLPPTDPRNLSAADAAFSPTRHAGPGSGASVEETPSPTAAHPYPQGRYLAPVFTTIATLGTPRTSRVQEIRIENFVPARRGDYDGLPQGTTASSSIRRRRVHGIRARQRCQTHCRPSTFRLPISRRPAGSSIRLSNDREQRVAIPPAAFYKVIVRPSSLKWPECRLEAIPIVMPNDQTDLGPIRKRSPISASMSRRSRPSRMKSRIETVSALHRVR